MLKFTTIIVEFSFSALNSICFVFIYFEALLWLYIHFYFYILLMNWHLYLYEEFFCCCCQSTPKAMLIDFREKRREGEREGKRDRCERETSLVASRTCPNWGPNQQLRHMPWLGIQLTTLLSTGHAPTNWATLVRAEVFSFIPANIS